MLMVRFLLQLAMMAFLGMSPFVSVFANDPYRPRIAAELFPKVNSDRFVRIMGAQVAWANFKALRRDFPVLKGKSEKEISDWILEHFAYISERQLELNGIRNTPVSADFSSTKTGYRPKAYGRAAVLEARGGTEGPVEALVDLKGSGIGSTAEVQFCAWHQVQEFENVKDNPKKLNELRTKDHCDGLMSLGEAIAEMTRQQAAQMLFDVANAETYRREGETGEFLETIESYFIIALPFDILKTDGQRIPGALYGRQPHWGGHESGYGYSQRGRDFSFYKDMMGGRQGTVFSAVDFGGVVITDPRLLRQYGMDEALETLNPQKSRPWLWGHRVAEAFRMGDIYAVYRHLSEMLEDIQPEWEKSREILPNWAHESGLLSLIKNGLKDRRKEIAKKALEILYKLDSRKDDIQVALTQALLTEIEPYFRHKIARLLGGTWTGNPVAKGLLLEGLVNQDRDIQANSVIVVNLSNTVDLDLLKAKAAAESHSPECGRFLKEP